MERVLFPCSASIGIHGDSGRPIVLKEGISSKRTVIAAEVRVGEGRFILLGTCVFWDNFAIKKYSNLGFSLNFLLMLGRGHLPLQRRNLDQDFFEC